MGGGKGKKVGGESGVRINCVRRSDRLWSGVVKRNVGVKRSAEEEVVEISSDDSCEGEHFSDSEEERGLGLNDGFDMPEKDHAFQELYEKNFCDNALPTDDENYEEEMIYEGDLNVDEQVNNEDAIPNEQGMNNEKPIPTEIYTAAMDHEMEDD